ncbi:MAG: hypothetical protein FJ098_00560 [Deltaproteobacteria bacterium]|nr:hypothetical protein [Deltaproteobacteria bacterium]
MADPNGKFQYDPTRALARVQFIDVDLPSNKLECLCNPTVLQGTGGQVIGELQPVGWSSPIIQSGYTRAERFSVEIYFSQYLYAFHKMGNLFIEDAISWLEGCVFPRSLGKAPPILRLLWPRTRTKNVIVLDWSTNRSRFNVDLRTVVASVQVNLVEIRKDFKTWQDHRFNEGRGMLGDSLYNTTVGDVGDHDMPVSDLPGGVHINEE